MIDLAKLAGCFSASEICQKAEMGVRPNFGFAKWGMVLPHAKGAKRAKESYVMVDGSELMVDRSGCRNQIRLCRRKRA